MQEHIKYAEFDKEAMFEKEIQPVLNHLKSLLQHYEVPYFFAAAVISDADGTEYVFESHDEWSASVRMKDDKIPGFIKVVNGFRTVLPDKIFEINL